MKHLKTLFAAVLALMAGLQTIGAQKKAVVYIFGVSDSVRDSIVYFTNVQRIDGAHLQKRTGFLLDRADYATQLKDYFSRRLNDPKRFNLVFFCKDAKKASKKLVKVRRNYLKEGAMIRTIDSGDFTFTPIETVYDTSVSGSGGADNERKQ